MKIIFLNTLNGKVEDGIAGFMKEQARDADIFCLQEVYDRMRAICKNSLADYEKIEAHKFLVKEDNFPQAVYIKKNLKIISSCPLLKDETDTGLGLYAEILLGKFSAHICDFHGASMPGDKLDNPGRIKQSRTLIEFFKDKKGPKIIGGDFNLLPETESIKMFEKNGYRNLIKDFKVPTTRNRLAWNNYPDNKQYYSDYVFVSPDVKVKNFSVPDIEVSDHLPMILEIE